MSAVIPDPANPTSSAIDVETGGLLGGVFIAPVDADPNDPAVWKHVGWSRGFGLYADRDEQQEQKP